MCQGRDWRRRHCNRREIRRVLIRLSVISCTHLKTHWCTSLSCGSSGIKQGLYISQSLCCSIITMPWHAEVNGSMCVSRNPLLESYLVAWFEIEFIPDNPQVKTHVAVTCRSCWVVFRVQPALGVRLASAQKTQGAIRASTQSLKRACSWPEWPATLYPRGSCGRRRGGWCSCRRWSAACTHRPASRCPARQ